MPPAAGALPAFAPGPLPEDAARGHPRNAASGPPCPGARVTGFQPQPHTLARSLLLLRRRCRAAQSPRGHFPRRPPGSECSQGLPEGSLCPCSHLPSSLCIVTWDGPRGACGFHASGLRLCPEPWPCLTSEVATPDLTGGRSRTTPCSPVAGLSHSSALHPAPRCGPAACAKPRALHPAPFTMHPTCTHARCTLHPVVSCTLYAAVPCTLRPAPSCALHPACSCLLCTLRPTPCMQL